MTWNAPLGRKLKIILCNWVWWELKSNLKLALSYAPIPHSLMHSVMVFFSVSFIFCQESIFTSYIFHKRSYHPRWLSKKIDKKLKTSSSFFLSHCSVFKTTLSNETVRNKSSFLRYLPLFWPVWQSRAAEKPNLSLSKNT